MQEARPNCRSGHIPGSRSVPFSLVLTSSGMMRAPEEIRAVPSTPETHIIQLELQPRRSVKLVKFAVLSEFAKCERNSGRG